jgi:hypothetical protein
LLGFQMVGESTKEQPAQFWTPLVGKETLEAITRGTAGNDTSVTRGLVSAFHPFRPLATGVSFRPIADINCVGTQT